MKGKALRRALATSDVHRITEDVPLIEDRTELITPDVAYAMLERNTHNRPINWRKVEEYADAMRRGEWLLHAQGIILDGHGNVLTGQKRLWAVIYSGKSVFMRVSRGNPAEVAKLLDRGTPQSSRDLAARDTGRKHSPVEASLARGVLALSGTVRPSADLLAETMARYAHAASQVLSLTKGMKKTRAVLMVLAAIVAEGESDEARSSLVKQVDAAVRRLQAAIAPQTPEGCWGRGAAFTLAMEHARKSL
jgi:hypothetical protein